MSKEIDYKRLYDQLKTVNSKLHSQIGNLQQRLNQIEVSIKQAMASKIAVEQITEMRLKQMNAMMNTIQVENQSLRDENKRLKDGVVD